MLDFVVRPDWHRLFDSNAWMLVPRRSTLVKLMTHRLETHKRIKVNSVCIHNLYFQQRFHGLVQIYRTQTFEYFLCPIKRTPDICRYHDGHHKTFPFPHERIGLLRSHVKPHFVVCNSAKKLPEENEAYRTLVTLWREFLSGSSTEKPYDHIEMIKFLGEAWSSPAPGEFATHPRKDEKKEPGADGSRRKTRSMSSFSRDNPDDGGDDDESDSASPASGGEHGRQVPLMCTDSSSNSDDSIILDDTCSDDTLWVEEIAKWASKGAEDAKTDGGWETMVVNDEQVLQYDKEPVRDPPPVGAWHGWRPSWKGKRKRPSVDTSVFSSNDWAAYRRNVYLTRA